MAFQALLRDIQNATNVPEYIDHPLLNVSAVIMFTTLMPNS